MTRDFGARTLGPVVRRGTVRESDTVMRLLTSARTVTTRYGGGFVQSIGGLAGSRDGQRDWFFYVNGSEAPSGAADFRLRPGEVVQWDFHPWRATLHIPAIVGAYPEPFVHGAGGRRPLTRVACSAASGAACARVTAALAGTGARVRTGGLGTAAGALSVVVAPWRQARRVAAVRAIADGPRASGVYVRIGPGGRALELLDRDGSPAARAPHDTGLLAATGDGASVTWVVTGLDAAGVDRAAGALRPALLRDAFALALTPSGPRRLPLAEGTA